MEAGADGRRRGALRGNWGTEYREEIPNEKIR